MANKPSIPYSQKFRLLKIGLSGLTTINKTVIRENWDDRLRLITAITLKEITLFDIIQWPNSYSRQHALYQTLKTFGQLIEVELANRVTRAVIVANPHEFFQAKSKNKGSRKPATD